VSDAVARDEALRTSGPGLFARYAYAPNELGYCGPDEPGVLLEAVSEGGHDATLAHLARQFDGAWPYLELIAGCNAIADPLDRRVVEAYWIGNELTREVTPAALAASLDERFARRSGPRFAPLVSAAWNGGVAQHNFHVFAVYPWLGLLRSGLQGAPLEVLDRCRIRWGTVVALDGDLVSVSSRALAFTGSELLLGGPRFEQARRSLAGIGFVENLAVGDVVALHWDWVCDRIDRRSLSWLRAATSANLRAVNTLPRPGPAAALEHLTT